MRLYFFEAFYSSENKLDSNESNLNKIDPIHLTKCMQTEDCIPFVDIVLAEMLADRLWTKEAGDVRHVHPFLPSLSPSIQLISP